MAVPARGNTTVVFNSVNITQYLSTATLRQVAERLDTTNLASTAKEGEAGDVEYSIPLAGNWAAALDTALAPEVGTGTKRTAVITFSDGSDDVSYTWTSNAEVQEYQVEAAVGGFIKWTGTLVLSGAPSRTVA